MCMREERAWEHSVTTRIHEFNLRHGEFVVWPDVDVSADEKFINFSYVGSSLVRFSVATFRCIAMVITNLILWSDHHGILNRLIGKPDGTCSNFRLIYLAHKSANSTSRYGLEEAWRC